VGVTHEDRGPLGPDPPRISRGRLRLRGSSRARRGGDGGTGPRPHRRGDRHQRRSRAARRLPPAAGGRTLDPLFRRLQPGPPGGTLPLVVHLGGTESARFLLDGLPPVVLV
ncbi:MAG: hypothetical protein AVDCRST_MAG59-4400, partial [uncultured Thermomicrobiales bacterium]